MFSKKQCQFFLLNSYLGTVDHQTDSALKAQQKMASHSNLVCSNLKLCDKNEFIKKFNFKRNSQVNSRFSGTGATPQASTKRNDWVDDLARKVKQVLPQVPMNVIRKDIEITKDIDDTIDRILSGNIQYFPESEDSPSTSKQCDSTKKNQASTTKSNQNVFQCGAATFGKNASQRHKSFEERKAQLFAAARAKYLEKYPPV